MPNRSSCNRGGARAPLKCRQTGASESEGNSSSQNYVPTEADTTLNQALVEGASTLVARGQGKREFSVTQATHIV